MNVDLSSQLVMKLNLDLRGESFVVDRDQLMNLPESILLCLFPNGLVLSKPQLEDQQEEDEEEEDIYYVDFDPNCFKYVIDFFNYSKQEFYGLNGRIHQQQALLQQQAQPEEFLNNPLLVKQSIIVLREELEYFVISNNKDENYKLLTAKELLENKKIFTALQRNINKENNLAEQHLIDMLCMSGFDRQDEWGFRSLEPNRCCITSIALVLLNTGISVNPPKIDQNQLLTAQKLLLFWRKPARKCWWDGIEIELNNKKLKVWSRRTWTLETSIF